MSNSLLFDGFAGLSGNMILGSLIDLGADQNILQKICKDMGLHDVRCSTTPVKRSSIAGVHVEVSAEENQPHRGLHDVLTIAERASLSNRAHGQVVKIFTNLAECEAKVHGIDIEKVHFHEVGAIDAIVDVVGSVALLESLEVDAVYCTPIRVGRGQVQCAHGAMPVPAPATARLLAGYPTFDGEVDGEFCTPTGAAILVGLGAIAQRPSGFTYSKVGHGAGSKDPNFPNILRTFLGATTPQIDALRLETIVELECNIDDMTGECVGDLLESLREQGAVDAVASTCVTKKNRPGFLIQVLCPLTVEHSLVAYIHRHSTTFGVRRRDAQRWVQAYRVENAPTPWGEVSGKRVADGRFFPEFDDCSALARANGITVDEVMSHAKAAPASNA